MVLKLTKQKTQYGIDNTVAAGALYLANGIPNVIAGRIAGREWLSLTRWWSASDDDIAYCDRVVKKYIEKRGHRRPEDRLRAAVIGALVIMPLSCRECCV